jgi:predicted porin
MNKKLIALAVAGACVAPAAMAQSANPVTLYGRIYVTVESVKTSGGSGINLPQRVRVEDQSSYLGVRGTEDLGGGLKAIYQLETQFRPDSNNTTFANRNSGVGLQGGWGTIMAGRWDMPFKTSTIAIDPYGDLTIGGITAGANDKGNFDVRQQNVIQYWSPNWGGFNFRLAYGANEGKTTTANPEAYGASLNYNKGPLYLAYAYEEHKNGNGGLTTVTPNYKEDGNAIIGSYQFGPVKIGALYEEFKKTNMTKQKAWMANAVWTIGKHDLSVQYTDSQDGGLNTLTTQPECQVIAVGWQYNFSKRTFFLTQYAKSDNNATSNCKGGGFQAGATGVPAGADAEGFSLGLRHVF